MDRNQLRQRKLLPPSVARNVTIGQFPRGQGASWSRLARLGAAAALVAAVTTVTARAVSPHATGVGRQPDGAVVVPTDQTLTPAGRQVEFAGRPNAVALSPDGTKAAFLTAGAKPITVVDLATGTVAQQFDPGDTSASFDGLALQRQDPLHPSTGDGRYREKPTVRHLGSPGAVARLDCCQQHEQRAAIGVAVGRRMARDRAKRACAPRRRRPAAVGTHGLAPMVVPVGGRVALSAQQPTASMTVRGFPTATASLSSCAGRRLVGSPPLACSFYLGPVVSVGPLISRRSASPTSSSSPDAMG